MQVRTLPGIVPPRLPTNSSQGTVAPVPAQDERSQPAVNIPVNRGRQAEPTNIEILAKQNQRYSYVKVDVDNARTSNALQTYFNIETQDDQERSQALFGVDILA